MVNQMFSNEDQMRNLIIQWLKTHGLETRKSVYVETFEIDIAAMGKKEINKDGTFVSHKNSLVYAFETKIATTNRLMKEVFEQALLRLIAADYVYIVVPKECERWANEKKKEIFKPAEKLQRWLWGPYSKKLGLITVTSRGDVQVVRKATKSGLTIRELRNIVIKQMTLSSQSSFFKFKKTKKKL